MGCSLKRYKATNWNQEGMETVMGKRRRGMEQTLYFRPVESKQHNTTEQRKSQQKRKMFVPKMSLSKTDARINTFAILGPLVNWLHQCSCSIIILHSHSSMLFVKQAT